MSTSANNVILDGDYVIAKTESAVRVVQLCKGKPLFLGKRKLHIYSVVGEQYGVFFEVKGNGALVIKTNLVKRQDILKFDEDIEMKDNRALIDNCESQKLTSEDIEALKAKGLSGQEMVKVIVENSSSFKDKSAFSQEKYLRKKQLKYLNFVQILKPNVRLLAEMYYSQSPMKICNLRIDSLSQMLEFCNILSGGKYIVVDGVLGLLTAAVIERLGNNGSIIQLHLNPFSLTSHQQAVKSLNLEKSKLETLLFEADLKVAMSILKNKNTENDEQMDTCEVTADCDSKVLNSFQTNRKTEKQHHMKEVQKIMSSRNMDSLLVAVKNHPVNLLHLLDFLDISRPFAIFSMYQEPLVACYTLLKSKGNIICLNITETWFRKYQVLPDRTHPDYSMSGNGGFLLTGIKVANKPK